MRTQGVFSSLDVLQDEAARGIRDGRAIGVLVRAMQYDLGIGDDSAAGILHHTAHAPERGLPMCEQGGAQKQRAGEKRKEAVIERPSEELALFLSSGLG